MKLIGKLTIHPLLFYTGKISGYITWVVFALAATGLISPNPPGLRWPAYVLAALAVAFVTVSSVNLGGSTSLGVPKEQTVLKHHGIYKFSRNPMYVGFHLLTVASMLLTPHWIVILLGLYSIFVYHLIILGEEKFLERRFGQAYLDYKLEVRRYL